jgi:hypothetical protein
MSSSSASAPDPMSGRDLSWFQHRIRNLERALAEERKRRPDPITVEVEVLPAEFAEGLEEASRILAELADRARSLPPPRTLRSVPDPEAP